MIKINRANNLVDYDSKYQVLIDNIPVMEIKNSEIRDYELIPGKHSILVKSDNFISNKLSFEIDKGEIIEFEVKPVYKNTVISKFLHKTVFGNMGIDIKIIGDIYL